MAEKIINTKDCCPFNDLSKEKEKALRSFAELFLAEGTSVFHLVSKNRNKEDDMPFAQLLRIRDDWNKKWEWKWCAGRWVGDIIMYTDAKQAYQIKVEPRFGYFTFFMMLEEIFSINILNNFSQEDFKQNTGNLIRQLLPFIWAQRLGEANKYGIPHNTVDVLHKGANLKGRLLVRKSILPFFKEHNVISATREKQVDSTISRIILQAYRLLNKPIVIDKKKKITRNLFARMSGNAQNAIINFENAKIPNNLITQKDYESIRYKSIYESWKSVVDFSWQIIQNHHLSQKESDTQKGFGMFVDMAEIWELFLRHILQKNFTDWTVESPEESIYNGLFYSRSIIPDVVMKRGKDVMVFDAKWKRMKCNFEDLDRSDFFQIHTYIHFYQKMGYNVIAGGLLYPISLEEEKFHEINRQTKSLFGRSNDNTRFVVDGICLGKEHSFENNQNNEEEHVLIEKYKKKFYFSVDKFVCRIRGFINEFS